MNLGQNPQPAARYFVDRGAWGAYEYRRYKELLAHCPRGKVINLRWLPLAYLEYVFVRWHDKHYAGGAVCYLRGGDRDNRLARSIDDALFAFIEVRRDYREKYGCLWRSIWYKPSEVRANLGIAYRAQGERRRLSALTREWMDARRRRGENAARAAGA